MSRRLLTCVLLIAGVLGAARPSDAAAIVLSANNGAGAYTYSFSVGANEDIYFVPGDNITLSGLSGVVAVTPIATLDIFFDSCGFTSTSVCLVAVNTFNFSNGGSSPFLVPSFVVNSTVLTVGAVQFEIEGRASSTAPVVTINGAVDGPVGAAAPEPASILLFGTGLLGAGFRRWRQKRS